MYPFLMVQYFVLNRHGNYIKICYIRDVKHYSKLTCCFVSECMLLLECNFMFNFPCIISLYYIKNQQDANLAVLCGNKMPTRCNR